MMRPGRIAAILALLAVGACAERDPGPAADGPGPVVAGCAAEAERLERPATVFAAPVREAAPVATLEAGRFIYRCERRDAWLGVRFPRAQEPVDCSYRGASAPCPSGWLREEPRTSTFD